MIYILINRIEGKEPSRFPLSFAYLVGGMLIICFYNRISAYVEKINLKEKNTILYCSIMRVKKIGRNSLFYLLVSNIFIFALAGSHFYQQTLEYGIIAYLVIVSAILYLTKIYRETK